MGSLEGLGFRAFGGLGSLKTMGPVLGRGSCKFLSGIVKLYEL